MPLTQRPPRRARTRALLWADRSGAADPFADSRLMARAGLALLLANVRYWTTVAPLVRAQVSRWERHAQAIPDPVLQTLARTKLVEERFNVEVAATLATLAPRAHRELAVEAIVALQVMYDYLDLLTEQRLPDPLTDGRRLFDAFTDALAPAEEFGEKHSGEYYRDHPRSRDGGYLQELVNAVRLALAQLPAADAVLEVAWRSARRCAEAQVLGHAAARSGTAELQRWASRETTGTALQWPEYFAGAAASVIAVHALIVAAATGGTTRENATEIDAAYLSICALTMLDSLVDHEDDVDTGELGYVQLYESRELMAQRLAALATDAAAKISLLPDAAHHLMTLVGVVAYYASAPAASSAFAQPVMGHMRSELRPLIAPTVVLMRAWRLAKRVRWPRRGTFHREGP
jgi:tetraprenyl-beta-curcumene synthase